MEAIHASDAGNSVDLSPAIKEFLLTNQDLPTPYLVMDLDMVEARYRALTESLAVARVLYAVKANPAREVLDRLERAGSSFDVASAGEIERCLKLGIDPGRLAYGNTIKKERDIAYAHHCGVATYTVDSELELDKVTRRAPLSTVYVRLTTDGSGTDWPLSRKFGCGPARALAMLQKAAQAGHPVGISFHVGSQQRNIDAWDRPLADVAAVARKLRIQGIELAGVNLGGGLPCQYRDPVPDIAAYCEAIGHAVNTHLGKEFGGEVLIEPGRFLVGDAGVMEAEVVLISRRAPDSMRWVYLDVGMFNGLSETLEEAIRYRIHAPRRRGPMGPVVLAGPSCDGADVLYERSRYRLPVDLCIGDRIQLLSTGAYTSSYSSVWFNGFEPLSSFFVSSSEQLKIEQRRGPLMSPAH